ncbi:MAG: hypothetical protein ACK4PH_28405 [Aquincola tertiaricarbonis]|uniref:hypothetical protein n=1 Tax=Aquincola TaxID=391952 RepID=UPI000614CABE|nr:MULTISPECIES: hypothetical protein [Aquincola]MCR5867508.1 hypothetical protein [Aquincola sp. J276]
MELRVNIEGATEEEQQRGIRAALAYLAAHGLSADQALAAVHKRDRWSGCSFRHDEPTDAEMAAADAWDEADRVAARACCADWPAAPLCADLQLVAAGAAALPLHH